MSARTVSSTKPLEIENLRVSFGWVFNHAAQGFSVALPAMIASANLKG